MNGTDLLCTGNKVLLLAHTAQHFLSAVEDKKTFSLDGVVNLAAHHHPSSSIFEVVQVKKDVVGFKSCRHGTYLCAELDGSLSQKPDLLGWEHFTVLPSATKPGSFTLRTAHGRYLRANTKKNKKEKGKTSSSSSAFTVDTVHRCKGWEQWQILSATTTTTSSGGNVPPAAVATAHYLGGSIVPTGTLQIKLKGTNGVKAGPTQAAVAPQRRQSTLQPLNVVCMFLTFAVFTLAVLQASTSSSGDSSSSSPASSGAGCNRAQLDVGAYLSKYPDIRAWIEDWTERRYLEEEKKKKQSGDGTALLQVPLDFDHEKYWAQNPEANTFVQQWTRDHFSSYGANEGRHSCYIPRKEDGGVDANIVERHAQTALRFQAIYKECGRMKRLLLLWPQMDVDQVDLPDGNNALHYAAAGGSADCVRYLLNAGATQSILTATSRKTAEQLARDAGHIDVVQEFLK